MSKTGDYGIVQINIAYNPEVTLEQALDPEYSLRWASQKLVEGKDYMWTACSCIQFAKALGVKIPKGYSAQDLMTNSAPQKGGLVLLQYKDIRHVAVITGFTDTSILVREANYEPCKTGSRSIMFDDKAIVGFWR